MKAYKTSIFTLIATIAIIVCGPRPAFAGRSVGFDTNDMARFSRVVCSVGYIQDGTSLADSPDLIKQLRERNKKIRLVTSVQKKAFDKVLAVGLSATEMRNLGVIGGDTVSIDAYNHTTKATVYRAFGAFRPPEGSINLSLAAAKKLQLRAGDGIIIRKEASRVMTRVVSRR